MSLPDRRAFAVAAALAETPIEECVYVSANPGLLVAAAAAGMRAVNVALAVGRASGRRPLPAPAARLAALAAAAARPSCSRARSRPTAARPTSSRGRVVTMDTPGQKLDDAQVVSQRARSPPS